MKTLFNYLKRLLTGRESEPPPPEHFKTIIKISSSDGPEELDTETSADESAVFSTNNNFDVNTESNNEDAIEVLDGDLWGTTFVIRYTDSKGEISIRRVKMHHFTLRPKKSLILSAHCFERNALRHFRFDRINEVVDDDGVVYEPKNFFRDELQCPIDEYLNRCAAAARQKKNQSKKVLRSRQALRQKSQALV